MVAAHLNISTPSQLSSEFSYSRGARIVNSGQKCVGMSRIRQQLCRGENGLTGRGCGSAALGVVDWPVMDYRSKLCAYYALWP